jgi:hypothetical protein
VAKACHEPEEGSVPTQDRVPPDAQNDDEFVPRGAIAFVALMAVAYGLIWFFFFFLMLGRP